MNDLERAGALGDYRVQAIEWSSEGNDLILRLVPPEDTDAPSTTVRFVWATKVQLNVDFGDYSGLPLIFGATVSKDAPDKSLAINIAFGAAPEGFISLLCANVVFE
jgi:hypothetical protein